ncbi:GDP-mannose 4,6-dehydratase [Alphaproteobacteria bacterium]|nr:GDP-mannose 4,6-dehydratase [Alphaproteobacteria bacterium]
MKKILVIGSNCFSGSHFVNYCLSKKYIVYGVSRSKEPSSIYLPYKKSKYLKNFIFKKLDLNLNLQILIKLIKKENITHIVNFASQSMVAESWQYPEDWFQTNVMTQVKMHQEIQKLNVIKKFIQVSTPEVYGSINGWKKESFNYFPSTPYATSRAACDMHLMTYFKSLNYPVIFTRAANVYGPGQQLYRIVPRAILFPKINKKLTLNGGGLSKRSFIHIEDVVRATFSIMNNGKFGEVYHISTNEVISIKGLVKLIFKINKFDTNKFLGISEERLGKDKNYFLSSKKIRMQLNWTDRVTLEDGIQTVSNWITDNLNIIKKHNFYYDHKK